MKTSEDEETIPRNSQKTKSDYSKLKTPFLGILSCLDFWSPFKELCRFVNKCNGNRERFHTLWPRLCDFPCVQINDGEQKKKGCKWLFTSHGKIQCQQLVDCLKDSVGDAVFKFEPFVMHIQCRDISSAQWMHSSAISAGFRNSGLSIGKGGKIISARRSTHSLEVPLTHNGEVMVSTEYLDYLTKLCNEKMDENSKRTQRFFDAIRTYNASTPHVEKVNKTVKKQEHFCDKKPDSSKYNKPEDDDEIDYNFSLFESDLT